VPVLLGVAGMAAALGLALLAGRFEPLHAALVGLGLASVFGGLLWQNDADLRATMANVAYSFFALLCGVLAYLIVANRSTEIDLTRQKAFTLSAQSLQLLRNIPEGVRLRVVSFAPAADHEAMRALFSLYEREKPPIDFEVYDPDLDIATVRQFGEQQAAYSLLAIRMESGQETRRVRGTVRPTAANREGLLTNMIADLCFGRERRIYVTEGSGERRLAPRTDAADAEREKSQSLSRMAESLGTNGWPVASFRLMQGIPDDAGLIVLAAPTSDLFEFERDTLLEFLRSGGRLLIFHEPSFRGDLPNIGRVLEAAGLASANEFLIDPLAQTATSSPFTPAVVPYGDHAIPRSTAQGQFFMNGARPVAPAPSMPKGIDAAWILVTGKQVWSMPPDELRRNPRPTKAPESSREGSRPVAAASTIPTPGGRRGEVARVVAVGDIDAFCDGAFQPEAEQFLLQSINWLTDRTALLDVPPRIYRTTPVHIDRAVVTTLHVVFLLITVAVGAGGVSLTIARRRRR
jgi:hypothetical protein